VPQDDRQAAVWFRKAAEQNFAPAQYALGALCTQGRGVPQDKEEAYFWFDLAAAGKMDAKMMETAAKTRDETASHLTPADLSRVQERARKWFEDHPAKVQ
jgi:TPR repeat protein